MKNQTQNKGPSERRNLADAEVLVVVAHGPGSLGPKLKSFISQHRRAQSGTFTYIGHPIPLREAVFKETEFLFYWGEDAHRRTVLPRGGYIGLPSLILDWVLTALFLARIRRHFDVCITMGLHLVLFGTLLKLLGMVNCTVSVFEEYRSQLYGWPVLRHMYRAVASFCCERSDFVVFTSALTPGILAGDGVYVDPAKQVIIPQPIDPSEIGFVPLSQRAPNSVLWIGQLTPDYGFELVIEAMALVVRKQPEVTVTVVSYTRLPDGLRAMIKEKGLEQHFNILGFIKEAEFNQVVRKHRVALALYQPKATSKKYVDVYRPWTYMANGVPHIINRVPPVAAEIEKAEAGIVIDYTKEALADAILSLLTDDQLHETCRQRGLELVEGRTSQSVLSDLLARLGVSADEVA